MNFLNKATRFVLVGACFLFLAPCTSLAQNTEKPEPVPLPTLQDAIDNENPDPKPLIDPNEKEPFGPHTPVDIKP